MEGKEIFCVENNYTNIDLSRKVNSIFFQGTKSWDLSYINNSFEDCGVKTILDEFALQHNVKDRVAWTNKKNEIHSENMDTIYGIP